jgi:hypothetical protein
VPLADQIACIEREIGYRLRVYPRRVEDKKMTQQLADRELDRMRAVLATLKRAAESEPILGGMA